MNQYKKIHLDWKHSLDKANVMHLRVRLDVPVIRKLSAEIR